MAKAQRGPGRQSRVQPDSTSGASAAFANLPDGSAQMMSYKDLSPHPDNRRICGELAEDKKEGLKEDLVHAGVREPLQIWWHEGTWIVVSGNERLEIVSSRMSDAERRSANAGEGLEFLPCIVRRFDSPAAARVHLEAANKNRKVLKSRPPAERLQLFMPPDEYPVMYARFKGNFADDARILKVELPGGNSTTLPVSMSGAGLQEEKKRLIQYASEITGWSQATVKKVLSGIWAGARPKSAGAKQKGPSTKLKSLDLGEMKFAMDHYVARTGKRGVIALRKYLDSIG